MTDIQLYTKLSELPSSLHAEVEKFIDYLQYKSKKQNQKNNKRVSGKAKGLIKMKSNFDEPIDGFKEYMK
ncbi:type II toxin-antitoxin system VapB family antitoxin [Brumimicrobium oceani]|uniref:DUF2281 domain-containing protein n=1 Tax=Brumimicrobium oceani TaxID=2100725 RepID=A0A2U2XDV3_9FLAO|nr:DUF2281 domain-containing protein [Brumimicrobium oceani]PWH85927.1 hypothetical protein DIT68_07500 [Brumimicrobium oceani]